MLLDRSLISRVSRCLFSRTLSIRTVVSSPAITSSTFHRLHERKSFGSFHSEDIEVLIRQSPNEFKVPDIYHEIHGRTVGNLITQSKNSPFSFGSDARRLYQFDNEWTFINHGAFGGALKVLLQQASLWREYCERQPLRFFDRELFPLIAHSLRVMAIDILQCPTEELLPLPNVTTGLNAIFQSTVLCQNDEIVHLSLTYGSTKKMMKDLAHRTGAKVRNVPLTLPVESEEMVIYTILQYINKNTKLIVLDHITSNTAMVLPVVEIAKRCKQINPHIVVVVDGAHSLFSQHVEIYPKSLVSEGKDCDSVSSVVDFWLTNGHKWFSTPKGCAFLWVSPKVLQLRPAIISHGFQQDTSNPAYCALDKRLSSFVWDGCRDYCAIITAASATTLWSELPIKDDETESSLHWDKFRRYNRNLLDDAEQIFKKVWSLEENDFACPWELRRNASMRLIPLPRIVKGVNTRQATDKDAFGLQVNFFRSIVSCG